MMIAQNEGLFLCFQFKKVLLESNFTTFSFTTAASSLDKNNEDETSPDYFLFDHSALESLGKISLKYSVLQL